MTSIERDQLLPTTPEVSFEIFITLACSWSIVVYLYSCFLCAIARYRTRGPPRRVSAYEISKSNGFQVNFGFQNGFLDFKVDFWISRWISGFQSGFLEGFLDFKRISGFQSGFLDFI